MYRLLQICIQSAEGAECRVVLASGAVQWGGVTYAVAEDGAGGFSRCFETGNGRCQEWEGQGQTHARGQSAEAPLQREL